MINIKLYAIWIFIFILSIPMAFNLVPPNRAFGFRTAKTLSNPQIWRQANAFSGWIFLAAALVGIGITYFKPGFASSHGTLLLLSILAVALIISLIYLNYLPG